MGSLNITTVGDINLDRRQTIEVLQHLRRARAEVSRDVEAFHRGTLTLEKIAHIAGASVGNTLGQSRETILSLFREESLEGRRQRCELFDTVLRARNMAIHGGAWVRHHTSRLVDLFLLLEEAIISKMEVIDQIMVRTPLEAKTWHRVGHARNDMLSNSFSALPISIEIGSKNRWMLLWDEAIMRMIWGKNREHRDRLLSQTIEEAMKNEKLQLKEAPICAPRDSIESIAARAQWPILVIDDTSGVEHLIGIVTPFDLL